VIKPSRKILFIWLLFVFPFILSCSRHSESVEKNISANALKGGGIAYEAFYKSLDKNISDNDFSKFANDPKNYDVVIKDGGDKFIYYFFPHFYKGRKTLDGRSVFVVNSKDWKVAQLAHQ
jgi:hypothetical protein